MASFSERTITERWTRRGRVSSDEHSIIPFLGTHIHVLLGLPRPTTPSFHLANVKRSLLFPAALSAPTHRTRPSWPQVWPVIINRVLNFPPHLICNGCYRIRRARKTSRKEIVDVHNARGEDSSRSDDWNRKISEKKYSNFYRSSRENWSVILGEKTFLGLLEIFSTIRCTFFEEDSKIN